MASPFQQQALQRKLIYTGLIVVLFTVAWGWRRYVVAEQAKELAVREESRGEVELTGAVVRLGLTGSRGLATCVLWNSAMDAQKKNQWNELELIVRSLTKLQPHFVTPWLFQSWNLAYNVSVESDRVADKYFYVTRGIQLLAEGERQNLDNPDMRWYIGYYGQHKVCQSDETNTMRSLFQLSYIPPNDRDPARFWKVDAGGKHLNWEEFEKFCVKYPQLMRRLNVGMHRDSKREQRRQFRCERPEDVVQFLADNYHVPSLYEDVPPAAANAWQPQQDRLRPLEERFPILPPPRTVPSPQHVFDPNAMTYESALGDDIDAFAVAYAWYCYAQEPIPDPSDLPGIAKPITNPVHQRRPRNMTTLIFRNYPAQAARYMAERLQGEGWFDKEGWKPLWFEDNGGLFHNGQEAVIGGRPDWSWSLEAWRRAARAWQEHGEQNHLLFSGAAEEQNMRQQAEEFNKRFRVPPGAYPPAMREESLDAETRQQYFAARFLWEYNFYRTVSNFPHHYNRSRVEAQKETVQARKLFFEGEELNLAGSPDRALEKFNDPAALKAFAQIVLKNKDFREDMFTQEQMAELEWKYQILNNRVNGRALKKQLAKAAAVVPLLPRTEPESFPEPLTPGPFEGVDQEGKPLLSESARDSVLVRMGVKAPPRGGPPPGMQHPTTPPARQ